MTSRRRLARRRVVGASVLLTCLGAAWLLSVAAAMPTTVLTESWSGRDQVRAVLPQSWAFFTRDPRTPALQVFTVDAGGERADALPQSRAVNWWGLHRGQRSQDTEKVLLAQHASTWVTCGSERLACLAEAARSAPELVPGAEVSPHFCGPQLLAWTEPISFVFRHLEQEEHRVLEVAHLEVACG